MKLSRETLFVLLGLFVGLGSAFAVPRYTPPPGSGGGGATPPFGLDDGGVAGVLPIVNGGTNSTATPTNGGVAYGDGTAYQFTTVGAAGQCLQSNGAAAPVWGSCAGSGGGLSYAEVAAATLAGF